MKWTKSRLKELDQFRQLLIDAGSINSGSHALDRIARVEKAAKRLFANNLNTARPGFYSFIEGLARADVMKKRSGKDAE